MVQSVMTQLEKRGKGIILMHDFQHSTAEGLPELIRQLQAGGYKVVHMVREPLTKPFVFGTLCAQTMSPPLSGSYCGGSLNSR
jgi:hypothetical protein